MVKQIQKTIIYLFIILSDKCKNENNILFVIYTQLFHIGK